MKKNLIMGCMAVFAVSVQAQEGWTLRQCIDYAIEHNISIRQSANTVEQSAIPIINNAGCEFILYHSEGNVQLD